MTEHYQEFSDDEVAYAVSRAMVKSLFDMGALVPRETISTVADGGHIWATSLEVPPVVLDVIEDQANPEHASAIAARFYRDKIIGHWIISGMDEHVSEAFKFVSANQADLVLFSDVSEYLAQGTQL